MTSGIVDMPKKIANETLHQAQELRASGKSYEEISDALKVSMSWCWHNLKSVRSVQKEIIDALEKKSRTRKGVSKGEIARAIDQEHKPEQLHKDVQKVSQRIKKRSKENVVRPNWMVPQFSVFMTEEIIQEAMNVEQRTHERAYELHCLLMSNTSTQEEKDQVPSVLCIKSAICGIAQAMTGQSSVQGGILNNWLESLHKTSVKLQERNPDVDLVIKVQKDGVPKGLLDLDDYAY